MDRDRTAALASPGTVVRPPILRRWLATFSSLGNRNYLLFWLGLLASFNAMQMQTVAQGWLVYDLTGSSVALGMVSAAWGLPLLALSLFGGVVADRARKRNILVLTQACMGLASIPIAVLIAVGRVEVWHLIAAGVLMGATASFNMPARQAFIRELVNPQQLMNAVALNSSAMNLTRVASPAIAGILVALIGVAGIYGIVAASYVLVVATLLLIPIAGESARRRNVSVLGELTEGLSYVRSNSTVMALMALAFIPVLVAMPYTMLMPVFAADVLHVGAEGLGVMMGAVGVGALVGSLSIGSAGSMKHKGLLLLGSCVVFGLGLVLFALARSWPLSLASLLVVGVGSAGFMTINNTMVIMAVSPKMLGRVMSVYMMTWGLMPVGTLPAGAIADVMGAPFTVGAGGVLLVILTAVIAVWRRELLSLE